MIKPCKRRILDWLAWSEHKDFMLPMSVCQAIPKVLLSGLLVSIKALHGLDTSQIK